MGGIVDSAVALAAQDGGEATNEPQSGDRLAAWAIAQMRDSSTNINKWRKRARECDRFNVGRHFSDADIEVMRAAGRPTAVFNAAQKWISYCSGIERRSRLEAQLVAQDIHNEAQLAGSDLVTGM